jgi:hypothetical protein
MYVSLSRPAATEKSTSDGCNEDSPVFCRSLSPTLKADNGITGAEELQWHDEAN